jgi:lactoylglutathione lyase
MSKGTITGLAHIGVFGTDINEMVDFYTNILGFECFHTNEIPEENGVTKIAFVKNGSCILELVQLPVNVERKDGPVEHISLAVDDIDAMISKLRAKGIEFETKEPIFLPLISEKGLRYINFRGPDGAHIELNQQL